MHQTKKQERQRELFQAKGRISTCASLVRALTYNSYITLPLRKKAWEASYILYIKKSVGRRRRSNATRRAERTIGDKGHVY